MSMLKIKSKWFPSWDASAGPPSIRLPSSVQRPYWLAARMLTCFSETLKEYACSNAKLLLSCLTLHKPMARSLPGPSVHWILQAKILEWVAMPFSRGSSLERSTQGLKLSLLHYKQILYRLSHWRSICLTYLMFLVLTRYKTMLTIMCLWSTFSELRGCLPGDSPQFGSNKTLFIFF